MHKGFLVQPTNLLGVTFQDFVYGFSVMDMFGFCDAWLVHSFVILLPFRFYFHSNWNVLRSP